MILSGKRSYFCASFATVFEERGEPAAPTAHFPQACQKGGYVGQMSEEQIRQKLAGEGFSEVSELKKIPVTRYHWTGKAVRGGKTMDITIDERGLVTAK